MRRYGPLVLSVCRQMLRDANDVDDAFQATFVVFIEKAATLTQPDRLGPWLYGVAFRVASRARRRRRTEKLPQDLPERSVTADPIELERLTALHEEIERLPEKYRLPIVLCCIAEETRDEAARKLNWPIGTVHGRLSRGRELLRGRLGRRGISVPEIVSRQIDHPTRLERTTDDTRRTTPSIVSGEIERPTKRPRAAVPESLLASTFALQKGAISTPLQALAKGVIAAMFIDKLKSAALVITLATIGAATTSAALLTFQTREAAPATSPRVEQTEPAIKQIQKEFRKSFVGPNDAQPAAIQKVAGQPLGPAADAHDGLDEQTAEKIAKMQGEVESLELDSESLRAEIQHGIALLAQLDEEAEHEEKVQAANRATNLKRLQVRRANVNGNMQESKERYRQTRVDIARLKNRIARESNLQPEGVATTDALAEVIRRFDRLEAKVDRLTDALPRARHASWSRPPHVQGFAYPFTVGTLKLEKPGHPNPRRQPASITGNDLIGLCGEVAHDLPADRRVRVKTASLWPIASTPGLPAQVFWSPSAASSSPQNVEMDVA